ncbi:APC family permease [Acidianus sp. RZ1]|uniref:APC family permease n=1 Tax=Acidianus sp. RZ1 TaxID=1540082 RepID=UPI00149225B9|nr:APC family permease [Acidianus sp. RZ1]NON62369.1 amino acid permease [Acidianus sp. RZ1]
MMSKNVFIRESSGLLKQVSLVDAIMLNIGNMSAGIALFESISPYVNPSNNPTIAGPGGVLWLASIIGALLAIPQLIIYTSLTRRMSRTGGDYIWISRSLNGPIGAIMAISLQLETIAYLALVSYFSGSAMNAVICTIGNVEHSNALLYLGKNIFVDPYSTNLTIGQRLLFYGISAAFFLGAILLNIFKAKWGYRLVSFLGIFSISTLVIAMITIAIGSSHFFTSISPLLSSFGVSVSKTSHAFLPQVNWDYTLLLLPLFALYTYPWMTAGPAVSAEFRQTNKIAKLNLIMALSMTALLVTVGFAEMDLVAGYYFNYFAYSSFIYNFWTVAIALASNPFLQWILGLGVIIWNFYTLSYGVIVFSRYIFALSFDRVLPEKFSQVNRYGSPVYAHILDLVITLSLLLVPVFSVTAAESLYGATILGAIYFFVVSIAGTVFGIKNKVKALTISGIISSIYFAFLTYEAGINPIFGFNSLITQIFVGMVIATGILIYAVSWYSHKKKGIDISLTFKEIPPE